MKKRNWLFIFSVILSIQALILLTSCSTSDEDDTEFQRYELNVVVGEGVSGTPDTGTYPYEEGDTVDYSYSLLPNYSNLVVTLDNESVEPSGTVTITGVHNLKASAIPVYDLNGDWSLQEDYDDGSSFSVTLTFTGAPDSGTVTDTDGGSGTYKVDNNNVITFNLVFPEVSYEYTGRFDDANNMSGDSERIIGSDIYFGSWSATRNDTTVKASTTTLKKRKSE